jgi:hypothetical protein
MLLVVYTPTHSVSVNMPGDGPTAMLERDHDGAGDWVLRNGPEHRTIVDGKADWKVALYRALGILEKQHKEARDAATV